MSPLVALFAVLGTALPSQDAQDAGQHPPATLEAPAHPERNDAVVLRIDDHEVRASDYGSWLLYSRGELLANDFALLVRLRRAAKRGGHPVDRAAIAREVEAEIERRIQNTFGGNARRWEAEIEKLGRSAAGYRAQRRAELELDRLFQSLIEARAAGDASPQDTERALREELRAREGIEPLAALRAHPGWGSRVDPEEPALAIDGESISAREYLAWLRVSVGELYARRFADEWCIERAAAAAQITIDTERAESRARSDLARRIEYEFDGDHEAWLTDLHASGRTPEQYERELVRRARTDLLVEGLILRDRKPRPEEVRAEWERVYGPGGRSVRLRWIRLDAELPEHDPARTAEQDDALLRAAMQRLRSQAADLRRRLDAGEDFATLAERESDDPVTRLRGGEPDGPLDLKDLPDALRAPVQALEPGQPSEPLEFGASVYLFEVFDLQQTDFESVREELEQALRTRRPTEVELAERKNVLARDLEVEVLPALYEVE